MVGPGDTTVGADGPAELLQPVIAKDMGCSQPPHDSSNR